MKLAEEGAHHLATSAAGFIDRLSEDYPEGKLAGFVVIAEVNPGDDVDETIVRCAHDCTWAHAAGLSVAAADGLRGIANDD